MSESAIRFCSSNAKPLLLSAGSLGLIGSLANIYFILQATAFDPLIISNYDVKLYSRLAATLYISLFSAFIVYAATTEHKAANKFVLILAVIGMVVANAAAFTIEDRVGLDFKEGKTWTPDSLDKLQKQLDCCKYDNRELLQPPKPQGGGDSSQNSPSSAPNPTNNSSLTTAAPSTSTKDMPCQSDCKPKIHIIIMILTLIFTGLASISSFALIILGATVYKTYQYDEANQAAYS